jgi:fatty acid desaturase
MPPAAELPGTVTFSDTLGTVNAAVILSPALRLLLLPPAMLPAAVGSAGHVLLQSVVVAHNHNHKHYTQNRASD